LEPLYATIDPREPLGRLGVVTAALDVAQSPRALDLGAAPRAVKLELPQVIVDHRFDKFGPGQHALAGRLRSVGLPFGPSCNATAIAISRHGISTSPPLMRPWCRS